MRICYHCYRKSILLYIPEQENKVMNRIIHIYCTQSKRHLIDTKLDNMDFPLSNKYRYWYFTWKITVLLKNTLSVQDTNFWHYIKVRDLTLNSITMRYKMPKCCTATKGEYSGRKNKILCLKVLTLSLHISHGKLVLPILFMSDIVRWK